MGGVTAALTRTGAHLYDTRSKEAPRQARRLLIALVEFGSDTSPHTRRRAWLEQVQPHGDEARRAFDAALEKLVAKRLVVRSTDSTESGMANGVSIEVAHEALLREWEQLDAWMKEDRAQAL